MAFAPRTVQNMPDWWHRAPISVLHPASMTPVPTNRCWSRNFGYRRRRAFLRKYSALVRTFPPVRRMGLGWIAGRSPAFGSCRCPTDPGGSSSNGSDRFPQGGAAYEPTPRDAGARDIDRRSGWHPGTLDRSDSQSIRLLHPSPPSFPPGCSRAGRLPDDPLAELFGRFDRADVSGGIGIANRVALLVPSRLRKDTSQLGFACVLRLPFGLAQSAHGLLFHYRHAGPLDPHLQHRNRLC